MSNKEKINLQNIPVHTELGREIRRAFVTARAIPFLGRSRGTAWPPFVAPVFEERECFVTWATEPFMAGLRRGTPARYAVIRNTPCPGLVWALVYGEGSEAHEVKRSDGVFYNGAPDRPEGAIEWAKASARAEKARIDRLDRTPTEDWL